MKFRIGLLISLAFIELNLSYGQANFQPGSLTLQTGIILTGNIDYKEWYLNPATIRFSESGEQNVRTYSAHDIRTFSIGDQEVYESHIIKKSLGTIGEVNGLSVGPNRDSVPDTVFLKVISRGKLLTLYSYRDQIKKRFYTGDSDLNITELLYYQYRDPAKQGNIISENTFRNQLLTSVYKKTNIPTSTLIRKLEKINYYQSDLEYIISYLNNEGKASVPSQSKNVHFYGGISLLNMNARYTGNHKFADGNHSSNALYPKVSAGIDIYNNYNIGKLLLRADFSLSFQKHKFTLTEHPTTVETDVTTHTFSQIMFHINPQVIYNIYNKKNCRVNIGSGIGGEFNFFPENEYKLTTTIINTYEYKNGFDLNKFRLFFPVRVGLLLSNRFDIYAQYNYYLIDLTPYTFYDISTTSLQAGINFMF